MTNVRSSVTKQCLFGGALFAAGLSQDVQAQQTTISDQLDMIRSDAALPSYNGRSYNYGLLTVDRIGFTVNSLSNVQIDALSFEVMPYFFDTYMLLFADDRLPLGYDNLIEAADDSPPGRDLNGSVSSYDSFLDITLQPGEYILVFGTFPLDVADAKSGESMGVLQGPEGIIPDHGLYQLDFFGDVSDVRLLKGPCPGDYNGDGLVNTLDMIMFLNDFDAREAAADLNGDGRYNSLDFIVFLNNFAPGC